MDIPAHECPSEAARVTVFMHSAPMP